MTANRPSNDESTPTLPPHGVSSEPAQTAIRTHWVPAARVCAFTGLVTLGVLLLTEPGVAFGAGLLIAGGLATFTVLIAVVLTAAGPRTTTHHSGARVVFALAAGVVVGAGFAIPLKSYVSSHARKSALRDAERIHDEYEARRLHGTPFSQSELNERCARASRSGFEIACTTSPGDALLVTMTETGTTFRTTYRFDRSTRTWALDPTSPEVLLR